jgi:hypothetical protein
MRASIPRVKIPAWQSFALHVLLLPTSIVLATETDFWQRYREPDKATWLLAQFDDDAPPPGTARIDRVEKIGKVEAVEGRFGRGMHFDGRSALRYATTEILPGGNVAIEAWIKLDEYPKERACIVCRPPRVDQSASYDPKVDVTKGFSLLVDHEGRLCLETTNCFYGSTTGTVSPAGAVPLGRWAHVAGTSVGHPIAWRRVFVDGREVAAAPITWGQGLMVSGDEEKQPGPVYLGNDAAGDCGLRGTIDQVRIHTQIVKFWPREDDAWTKANQPGKIPSGPPHFLPRHAPAVYLPLDGDLKPRGLGGEGIQVRGGKSFAPGVCGQALSGTLELTLPETTGTCLLDPREGSLEFWLQPGGMNSYSDGNWGFVGGPFIFYTLNTGTLDNKPLTLYFRKQNGDLHFLHADDFETHPGRWYHFVITWRDDEVAIYADGRAARRSFGVPLAEAVGKEGIRQLTLGAPGSLIDEVRLYRRALEPEEAANAFHRYRDRQKLVEAVPRAVWLRAQYFPSQNGIVYRLRSDGDTKPIRAVLTLADTAGRELARQDGKLDGLEHGWDIPDLPSGKYRLSATAIASDGKQLPGDEVGFRRQHFAWEGNQLGLGEEVYPPFEPIRFENRKVRIVGREYTIGGFGLPEQIRSAGRDLLAGPIVLRCRTAKGEEKWTPATPYSISVRPHLAVFEAKAETRVVRVRTRSSLEVDGCMKIEMTLAPGDSPVQIERLWLDIPLAAAEAPLMHVVTAGVRQNYSGAAPAGQGVVWDSRKAPQYQRWLNAFVPYVWLGSPNRGLAWFAENDRGWITKKSPDVPIQEIVREGNRLVFRVYLVNTPTVIREERKLVFGLQASPTKPMPSDWRERLPHAPGGLAVVPWGGLQCASQAPFHDDWQIVDKILECRAGKPFDRDWFQRYFDRHRPPPAHGNWPWLDAVQYFAGRAKDVGPSRPIAVYQEEMRGCCTRPEWVVFQDEWTSAPRRYQRDDLPDRVFADGYDSLGGIDEITFPRSYQDFGCSVADQWLRRGVSLYWDNTYPYASTNVRTTAAYAAQDGRVQPCMIIWNQREYAKRAWRLMQARRKQSPEPLEFTLHMTNTLLLPVHTWGTVDLDHELATRDPFTPEWLQTETVGLQVGNLPLSLYDLTGPGQPALEGMPSEEKALVEWGMRAVHEIGREGPMEARLRQFGYGTPAVTIHNYWADRPAVRVKPSTVKWLLVDKPAEKSYVLVLASWSLKPERVEVGIDPAVLGRAGDGPVRDLTFDRPCGSVEGGRLQIELKSKYQVRVLKVTTTGNRTSGGS